MAKEEKELEQRFGKQTPFRVPENYFDNFTSQVMAKLPESDVRVIKMQPSVWRRLRPALLAAACVLAVVFSMSVFFNGPERSNVSVNHVHPSTYSQPVTYSVFDQAADYTMVDNEEIYAYVSEI
ncbi:MAG: hypothetical protein MSD82_08690 [Prevotella sp.]|nr:hypothetical protein [Prevotella sp.]